MATLTDADARDPLLFPSAQLSENDTTSTDNSPLLETTDDMTTDWTQWMRWDEIETDEVSNHMGQQDCQQDLNKDTQPNGIVMPAEPDFIFHGSVSPTDPHGVSPSSFEGKHMLQPPFSPTIPVETQTMPGFAPPSALNIPLEQTPTSNSGLNFPLTPVSTSSISRKRKTSEDNISVINPMGGMSPPSKSLPSKKRSHNVIEKRYRANLNEKIAELRDSVPCLRVMYKQRFGGSGKDDDDETVSSSNKLNKASILSKATEYIKHLELRNKRLDEENIALKNRLREVEKSQEQGFASFQPTTVPGSSPGASTVTSDSNSSSPPSIFSRGEFSPEGSPNPLYPPEGLIKVPEFFKSLRPSGPQPHYADSLVNRPAQRYESTSSEGGGRRGGVANKFMLGTLAGLMVVGTLESQSDEASEKGLMGLPIHLLSQAWAFSRNYIHIFRPTTWQIRALLHFVMTSVFVFGCAFFVFLYLFYSRPRLSRVSRIPKVRTSQSEPTATDPADFRRVAWLTSIQTVGVPNHTFFPEWLAVTSRCLEYCLRCLLGWKLYSLLTGISEDDEKGRVKAWDIALDAQLTGGDAEVSKSRIVLTIFAAGTLPHSPGRCMLKALHCRVLLWRVGTSGSYSCMIANHVAGILAKYQWELSRKIQNDLPKDHEDSLPSHLAELLEYDCEEVLTDTIVQRASNMIWNRPTQDATDGEDGLLDVVAEDTAIRSPLDALAAWWSSRALQAALIKSLDVISVDCPVQRRGCFDKHLNLALNTAPITSAAYTRAAAIKALFSDDDRVDNINSVLAALPRPKKEPATSATIFLDSSVPPSARYEICIAVRCAMIAAILRGQVGAEGPNSTLSLHNAIELFNRLPIDAVELTLLGFASLYHLLHIVSVDERLIPASSLSSSFCSTSSESSSLTLLSSQGSDKSLPADSTSLPLPDLARVASGLIYWVRNAYNPMSSGFTDSLKKKVVEGCLDACRNAGVDVSIMEAKMNEKVRIPVSANVSSNESSRRGSIDESAIDEKSENKGHNRRESTRSDDTGYGSLSQDESCSS